MRKLVEKIIEYCALNKFIVFVLVGLTIFMGIIALRTLPLDAIPDLSETQVIIYSRWDRSPDTIEDQVTYPIISALLGAPKVKAIRGFSDFGYSFIYVIFEEGTDVYWARSRTLEYLSKITSRLPDGVETELGPDATGVGWVFQYALVDESGKNSLSDLRTFQDWYLRYYLQSVPGVAEVAPIGGFVRQYQVNVDPNKLSGYNIPINKVIEAIRKNNNDAGGRLVEFNGIEYMIRSRGYAKSTADIENIAVGIDDKTSVPVLVKNVASVTLGPDIRRGVADLDGKGDVVGGIVVMRYGESALNVIKKVKAKLKEIEPSLPEGVKIVTTYDRTELITSSIKTVNQVLTQDFIIVAGVIIFFLLHVPSALIPIMLIPIAGIIAFIPFAGMRLTVNIMSITGIVLAVGDMVDAGVVMVENVHTKLHELSTGKIKDSRSEVIISAMKEVGPTVFFALLVTVIGLTPLFTLESQEGRLFRPLAATQIFTIFSAAILSITLIPALIMVFLRNVKGRALNDHRPSRIMAGHLRNILMWTFANKKITLFLTILILSSAIPVFFSLGSEFMPPLYEGSILYMPTTLPGISVAEAHKVLQSQDKILKSFPEVERVFGKAGRIESSTDPAPLSMIETTIILKPKNLWRKKPVLKALPFLKRPITFDELVNEMDERMQFPGITNSWTMPIKARIDMLSTGVRTPVGIKIYGSNLDKIEALGEEIEKTLKNLPGTRSIYAERTAAGYFLDFNLKRDQLARHGLSIDDVGSVVSSAIGGEDITTTVEGRERYSVNVRYPRELRDNIDKLKRVLIPTLSGAQVPLEQLADIKITLGPSMIRNENGMLSGYVYIDVSGRDIGRYVSEAKKIVKEKIKLPPGYAVSWSGQYEYMDRVKKKLIIYIPLALMLIFVLYYFEFKSLTATALIMLAMPFTAVGSILGIKLLGFNISIAVWAGMIEVVGIGAALCALVITYLNHAYDKREKEGRAGSSSDIRSIALEGATRALRPAIMTCSADILGLMPALWVTGIGAEVLKRYTTPIIFGLFTAAVLSLILIPTFFVMWKEKVKKASV
ncbi:MAG: efflux RND transporter permease subunit [Candidatus Omnitrophica bacterium]|nr:efflux RND transporter permease subunit [Candidatus Omnitrophota bacterium]